MPGIIRVHLGRRLVGRIVPVKQRFEPVILGYRYCPNGGPPGETFKTVEQVKASIEGRVPA